MATRTRDGIRLDRVVRTARKIPGISVREGTNHPYILNFDGLRPCPIATSTDIRRRSSSL